MQFASAGQLVSQSAAAILSVVQGPILDYSGHNYKLTLLFGASFALISVVLLLKVRRNLTLAPQA